MAAKRFGPSLNAASLASLPETARAAFLKSLTAKEAAFLAEHWPFWARADQLPPATDWTTWLVLGGRGAGKTRAGAEWVRAQVEAARAGRIALVGETYADAREVMVDGPSGLMAISGGTKPKYEASRKRLLWPNGAVAQLFSATEPESLRGPQFDAAWADELAKWRYAEAAWDMLQFGLRLGNRPRQVVTTTRVAGLNPPHALRPAIPARQDGAFALRKDDFSSRCGEPFPHRRSRAFGGPA